MPLHWAAQHSQSFKVHPRTEKRRVIDTAVKTLSLVTAERQECPPGKSHRHSQEEPRAWKQRLSPREEIDDQLSFFYKGRIPTSWRACSSTSQRKGDIPRFGMLQPQTPSRSSWKGRDWCHQPPGPVPTPAGMERLRGAGNSSLAVPFQSRLEQLGFHGIMESQSELGREELSLLLMSTITHLLGHSRDSSRWSRMLRALSCTTSAAPFPVSRATSLPTSPRIPRQDSAWPSSTAGKLTLPCPGQKSGDGLKHPKCHGFPLHFSTTFLTFQIPAAPGLGLNERSLRAGPEQLQTSHPLSLQTPQMLHNKGAAFLRNLTRFPSNPTPLKSRDTNTDCRLIVFRAQGSACSLLTKCATDYDQNLQFCCFSLVQTLNTAGLLNAC